MQLDCKHTEPLYHSLCTHLYLFSPVSIYSLQCIHCLLQLYYHNNRPFCLCTALYPMIHMLLYDPQTVGTQFYPAV